jgi:hypothetical protein
VWRYAMQRAICHRALHPGDAQWESEIPRARRQCDASIPYSKLITLQPIDSSDKLQVVIVSTLTITIRLPSANLAV